MARTGRKDRGLLSRTDAAGTRVWYVRLWHEGKERRFGSFTTKTAAREFYEKAKAEQSQGRFFPERYQHGGYDLVEEFFEKYMLTAQSKKAVKDEKRYAKWWGTRFKGKRLNAITPAAIEDARQYLLANGCRPGTEKRPAKGCTPQTVNRYQAWLRHVLNVAVRDGKLPSNAAAKVKFFKEPKGKTRFLSPEEEKKLLEALGPVYGPWARLAILTGMRQDEQFGLRWKDVDLERGLLSLPTTKAGDCQAVHLNEEARAILRGLDSWERSVWVFPSKNPATYMNAVNFYVRIWSPAVNKAGIEWITWHGLRHTFASRLAMNGQNEGTIAALLRHSTTALVKRYAHLSGGHLRAAVEGVANFGKAAPAETKPAEISTPTVTGTGTEATAEAGNTSEVVEVVGGPGRN